jgi:hypothetical protein
MDFSSDVFIDVGLNLAGYLVAALLGYLIAKRQPARRRTAEESPAAKPQTSASAHTAPPPKKTTAVEPEFVSLSQAKDIGTDADPLARAAAEAAQAAGPVSGEWRRQNRRAIYAEARRLLARGDSPGDLLKKLPVTESELDMLTVAGRA